jgi:hypothetical protein
MRFVPAHPDLKDRDISIRLEMLSAEIGEIDLLRGASNERTVEIAGRQIDIQRSPVLVERYEVLETALEQILLVEKPEGFRRFEGNLTFTYAMKTELTPKQLVQGDERSGVTSVVPGEYEFVTETGKSVMTYGQAVAFDAQGREIPVSLTVDAGTVNMSIREKDLAGCEFPLTVDPLLGVNFSVNTSGLPDYQPDVCYSSSIDRYIAVYERDWTSDRDILSSLINPNGTVTVGNQYIDGTIADDSKWPKVAVNNTGATCLVVYKENQGSGPFRICGRILTCTATNISVGTQFWVSPASDTGTCDWPDVGYSTASGDFLVVWEYESSATDHQIYGQYVTTSGTLSGSRIQIAAATTWECQPTVTPLGGNPMGVGWTLRTSQSSTDGDIEGRPVSTSGTLYPRGILSNRTQDEGFPELCSVSSTQAYVVLSYPWTATDTNIRTNSASFTTSGVTRGTSVLVEGGAQNCINPHCTMTTSGDLLITYSYNTVTGAGAWGTTTFNIEATNYNVQGTPTLRESLWISQATDEQDNAAVASRNGARDGIAIFNDLRGGGTNKDIYAQRFQFVTTFPEMDVDQAGSPIADGGTDTVGNQQMATPFNRTYTIQNTGTAALNLFGSPAVTLAGQTNCTASVTTQPTTPVAAGGSTTLTVSCTPTAVGAFSFTVTIPNDDGNESPYDWTVSGTGTAPPFIPVAVSISVVGAPVFVPSTGGTFQAIRAIQNTGAAAGTTPYTIYISTDQTIDATDTQVFTGTTASIAAGATDTQTDTCTVPGGLTPGTQYYVGLFIAAGNTAVTTNQDVTISNFLPVAQSITTVGAPLQIPVSGGTFQATRAIQNTGTAAGTTTYDIYISTDATIDATDTQVFTGTTASIAAGATDTQTDTCTVPAGLTVGNTYYVGLFITAGNTAVTAQTDITIVNFNPVAQTISVIGAPVNILSIGGSFQDTRSIQNTGGVAGTATYDIYLSTDQTYDAADISVFSGTTASIAAGATDTATDTCTVAAATTPGTYYVILYLAPTNEVSTTNQDVTVLAPFNAAAQAITVQGAPVTVGQNGGTFQVSRQIDNTGGDPGTATYEIYLSTDTAYDAADILAYNGTTAQITGGASDIQTDTCLVLAATTPGSYYVILYISATPDEVATTNADVIVNDFNPQATSVAPLNTPVRIPAGQTFQATRTITNTGTAAGVVNYEIYLSTNTTITTTDVLVFSGTTASIAGSGTDTNSVTITVPASTAYDLDYYVGLYIASTNTAASTDTVHVLPNFARYNAVSVVEASTTVNINENLQVQVDIQNTGGVAGAASYSVYLSADNVIDLADRELLQHVSASIAAEGTDTEAVVVTIPGDIPAGTYWVGIYITSVNVQTQTAVSGGISITVPRDDDDDGSCGSGTGGGSLWAFLPLAMLAALCLALRRKLALER